MDERDRIADLVERACATLLEGRREEALDLLREAVEIDGGRDYVTDAVTSLDRDCRDGSRERVREQRSAGERKVPMASQEKLSELFTSSEAAYASGDQARAMAALRKARQIAPGDQEVARRIVLLKKRIKSSNLVRIARRELDEGNPEKAVELARRAFDLMPDTDGLGELLDCLEEPEPTGGSAGDAPARMEPATAGDETPAEAGDVPLYITRIRSLVQDNALEEAAELSREAYRDHPEDELLQQFVQKFSKLGLI